nr:MAG TPA: hypothetical protein [Caudoviricetes sp.]
MFHRQYLRSRYRLLHNHLRRNNKSVTYGYPL